MNNSDFKVFESEHFKKQVGLLTFTPSVSEWIDKTNAIGLYVKKGRYGGTYAHKDIAFEFASAISPVFKLYLIKEFERLKSEEQRLSKLEWDAKRFLSKNNYFIQTNAIKNYTIPNKCSDDPDWLSYAEEADMIRDGISKQKRFEKLQAIAKYQLTILHEADKLHLPEKNTWKHIASSYSKY